MNPSLFDKINLMKLNCNSSYEHKLIFCSDQAIINDIVKVFPYATILLCYTHLKKSIERSVDKR